MINGEKRGRGRSEGKIGQVFTQVRIDEPAFLKGKILAAVYDESFNHFMVEAIKHEIQLYEEANGPLPNHGPKTKPKRDGVSDE